MGRSASPAGQELPAQLKAAASFEAAGLRYTVERQEGAVIHHVAALPHNGRVPAEVSAEVAVAIGSGRQGQSFLVNRGGWLLQSPISWYTAGQTWRLSPGFERNNEHFNRRVVEGCLYCHANEAHAEPGTVNAYRPAELKLEPIGCERCHGPGELHALAREAGATDPGADLTIVNPRRLDPPLREAVCEQCHLQGEARIVRRGRSLTAFRPGLPLDEFVAVLVLPPDQTDTRRAVSHVEQMHLSRCFRASAGKLGCTSCHDPHVLPSAAQRVAWYRDRCNECHHDRGCAVPGEERRRRSPADSCIDCHMPRGDSSNIAHTSVTDHRIVRRPDAEVPALRPPSFDLVPFHHGLTGADRPGAQRDLGLALVEALAKPYPEAVRRQLARRASDLLSPEVDQGPDDLAALNGLALALREDKRLAEALAVLDKLLQQSPRYELALEQAALITLEQGDAERSATYWRLLVEVNPYRWENHGFLAQALALQSRWAAAADAARAALRLDPFQTPTRMLLIDCLIRAGEGAEARAEFDTLVNLRPAQSDELQRWFAKLRQPGAPN
jgi:hypothetical protein